MFIMFMSLRHHINHIIYCYWLEFSLRGIKTDVGKKQEIAVHILLFLSLHLPVRDM